MLEQFQTKCQSGDPESNLGGIRVLMDALWKLFTRRRTILPEDEYKSFANKDKQGSFFKDEYYWVMYVQKILELLTDLCIGPSGAAVKVIQNFVANDLIRTNEANAVRRRPEPESHDNVWIRSRITVADHQRAKSDIERAPGFSGDG